MSIILPVTDAGADDLRSQWHALLRHQAAQPVPRLLHNVQVFFAQVGHASDRDTWGVRDYWAAPQELLQVGRGDCEDLAIAKFYTLRLLGVPERDLRLVYGKRLDPVSGRIESHMVLVYHGEDGTRLVLDNRAAVVDALAARTDLVPEYGFNTQGLWVYRSGIGAEQIGASTALAAWRQLRERVAMEPVFLPLASSASVQSPVDG